MKVMIQIIAQLLIIIWSTK